MKILYFAWLREKAGVSAEEVSVPEGVRTVQGLVDWLKRRSPGHAAAFENAALVRCAVNQDFAALDAPIGETDEIAFFPPVTGG